MLWEGLVKRPGFDKSIPWKPSEIWGKRTKNWKTRKSYWSKSSNFTKKCSKRVQVHDFFLLEKIPRSKMYILLGGYSCSLYDKSNFVCTFLIQEQQCCNGPVAPFKQLYEIIIHWRSHPNLTCVKTKIYITGDSSFFYSKFKLSVQILCHVKMAQDCFISQILYFKHNNFCETLINIEIWNWIADHCAKMPWNQLSLQ